MKKIHLSFTLNQSPVEILVQPNQTLIDALRNELGMTGVKHGCGLGDCGSCTVLMDGNPVNSCLILAAQAQGREITTIEGLAQDDGLHPLQEAFVQAGAIQCGYCTPGMILSAKALLDRKKRPTETDIRTALSGNLCRCTGYQKIVEAVGQASKKINGRGVKK